MAESSISGKKRAFSFDGDEDDYADKQPAQKRVRFPKGKKVKPGESAAAAVPVGPAENVIPGAPVNPRLAATERANRRSEMTLELINEESRLRLSENSKAEVEYEDNENFEDDGIQIEPFNLEQERKEGYFDESGNYVEYLDDKGFKDPWLDNVEVDTRYAEKASKLNVASNETHELTNVDIGKMKRRIADILEPEETVLKALRRLKGTSNRKEKMSAEKKFMFDQLTEDAMKLLENGDYNVYEERKEVFDREAEGYERLARAGGRTQNEENGNSSLAGSELLARDSGVAASLEAIPRPSGVEVAASEGDEFDMFGEDDEPANTTASNTAAESFGALHSADTSQTDYVYDESSGYYYSSSSGYYYDATSGLYCEAGSGQWYSYNTDTSTYEEVKGDANSFGAT